MKEEQQPDNKSWYKLAYT